MSPDLGSFELSVLVGHRKAREQEDGTAGSDRLPQKNPLNGLNGVMRTALKFGTLGRYKRSSPIQPSAAAHPP